MAESYKSVTGLLETSRSTALPKEEILPPEAPPPPEEPPQFAHADILRCAVCKALIAKKRYVLKDKFVCGHCATAAGIAIDSPAAYRNALVFGTFVALGCLGVYAGITIVTHVYLGYVVLIVGLLVGYAVMIGSQGVGGPRYQTVAVALTYASMSVATVPIYIAQQMQSGHEVDLAKQAVTLISYAIAGPFMGVQDGLDHMIGLGVLILGMRVAFSVAKGKPTSQVL